MIIRSERIALPGRCSCGDLGAVDSGQSAIRAAAGPILQNLSLPSFSAPYCQLLPRKHFCHCLQQIMSTIPSAPSSGMDIAPKVPGSRGVPENLRICRNKGRRVPFCCSSDRSSSISARRPDCEGELQNQQRRMPYRPILLPRIRRTVEQLDGPAKHRLQLLVSVLIARHAAVTSPPDSG